MSDGPDVLQDQRYIDYWKQKLLTRAVALDIANKEFFEALNAYMKLVEKKLQSLQEETHLLREEIDTLKEEKQGD